jgi:hypothetical protein
MKGKKMKSRIFIIFSVVLIFLSANVLTYSQSRTDAPHKNTSKTQVKQVSHVSKANQVKDASLKTARVNTTDKKVTKTTKKVKDQKSVKTSTKKTESTKVLKHHKIMLKKTQKKESNNTPHKK